MSPQAAASVTIVNEEAPESDADIRAAEAAFAAETATVGERLAAVRKARGYSLETVHAGTKVKVIHLEAIEAGDLDALPAVPFAAGFVKAYAQFLELDPDASAAAFRAEAAPPPPETETQSAPQARALPSSPVNAPIKPPVNAPFVAQIAGMAPQREKLNPLSVMANLAPETLVAILGVGATVMLAGWIAVKAFAPAADDAQSLAAPAPTVAAAPVQTTQAAPVKAATVGKAAPTAAAPEAPKTEKTSPAVAERVAVEAAEIDAPSDESGEAPAEDAAADEVAIPADAEPAMAAVPVAAPTLKPAPTEPVSTTALMREQIAAVSEDATAGEEKTGAAAAEATPVEPAPAVVSAPIIQQAELTHQAAARYPNRCTRGAEQIETVRIEFDITPNGQPARPRVIESSNDCFDAAAIDAAMRMRFMPRLENGAPVTEFGRRMLLRFDK